MNSTKAVLVICLVLLLLVMNSLPLLAQERLEEQLSLEMEDTPQKIEDLVALFSYLEFNMLHLDEQENVDVDLKLEYQHTGPEEIQGVQADKFLIRGSEQIEPMDFWIADGEVVQLQIGAQTVPAQMIPMMKEQISSSVFFPFHFYEQLINIDSVELGADIEISRKQSKFGEEEVDIIELELLAPIADLGLESGFIKIVELEGVSLVVEYDIVSNQGSYKFNVSSFELR